MVAEAQLQWTAFVSVRRNVLLAVVLAALGLGQAAVLALATASLNADRVLDVTPQDLFGLVLRNQMFLCLLSGILGVSATASDRRSGLMAFRVGLRGRQWSLVSGAWLFGVLLCAVLAVAAVVQASLLVRIGLPQGAALEPVLLAASVGGLGIILLYHFAWGVVSGCLSNRYWLQITLLVGVPWLLVPIVRGTLVAAAAPLWHELGQWFPFESPLVLGSWPGGRNALLENAPTSVWPALAASLLFLLVGVLVHLHLLRRRPLDAT